eukprot:4400223-Amphidinium_carterae.1
MMRTPNNQTTTTPVTGRSLKEFAALQLDYSRLCLSRAFGCEKLILLMLSQAIDLRQTQLILRSDCGRHPSLRGNGHNTAYNLITTVNSCSPPSVAGLRLWPTSMEPVVGHLQCIQCYHSAESAGDGAGHVIGAHEP